MIHQLNLHQTPSPYKNWRWWAQLAAWLIVLALLTTVAGWTVAWCLSRHRSEQPTVILIPPIKYSVTQEQDQRAYIESGCRGHYQGAK